ncbi:hypothetical protein ACFO5K_12840 [Nocardia halotolerans]|uniref:Uncharacterized protein n=1 Tax=Nocardia halotolerans TaxID=1755878 RepID=A0ABV8VG62_9NOCA
MSLITRLTIGALSAGVVLSPVVNAQAAGAQTVPPVTAVDDNGSTGSSSEFMCTLLRLVHMNQGPEWCA